MPARFLFRHRRPPDAGPGATRSPSARATRWWRRTGRAGSAVGDGTTSSAGCPRVQGILVVFTRTGRVFTLNGDGTANDLFPGLRQTPPSWTTWTPPGGRRPPGWTRSGSATGTPSTAWTWRGGPVIEDVGPGRLVDNGSVVGGPRPVLRGAPGVVRLPGGLQPRGRGQLPAAVRGLVPAGAGEDAALPLRGRPARGAGGVAGQAGDGPAGDGGGLRWGRTRGCTPASRTARSGGSTSPARAPTPSPPTPAYCRRFHRRSPATSDLATPHSARDGRPQGILTGSRPTGPASPPATACG